MGTADSTFPHSRDGVLHALLHLGRQLTVGRHHCTLRLKLRANTTASDFYVAVLTHDETTTDGKQRARQNAIAETLLANQNWPGRLAILREGEVEIPSNLQGLGYISLEDQWSVRLFQESRAAGLA